MSSLETAITNSYSEEAHQENNSSFDPPVKGQETNNKRSYDDALLLASLSDDVDDGNGRELGAANEASKDTQHAATPRRSNASATPKESFTLYPKQSAMDDINLDNTNTNTPEQSQQGAAKKVTPEREIKQQQQQQQQRVDPSRPASDARYTPHWQYPAYPTPYYGWNPPYYPPTHHHRYHHSHPPPPPPPHHHAANAPPTPSQSHSSQQQPPPNNNPDNRESYSPLPYHPLSHVGNAAPHHPSSSSSRYEEQPPWGSWAPDHPSRPPAPWGGYYPYPPPPPPGAYPPAANAPPYPHPHNYPSNSPPSTAHPPPTHPPRSSNPTSAESSSPARSVKPWVSMDENSPRVDYNTPGYNPPPPPRYEYPSTPSAHPHPPPGTPSRSHAAAIPPTPSSSHHPPPHYPPTPSHPYYGGDYHSQREYATPPPPVPPSYEWEHHHPHAGNHSEEESKSHQFRKGVRGMHSEPVILKKKFSWRNYPELEEYLIANRTEYLHHSSLNYTAEQKHFNNRLTEGLLELAAKHNYIFDESCFNFVAVRDRIRCYYKSYVQSSKKRGVIVGFPRAKRVKTGDVGNAVVKDDEV